MYGPESDFLFACYSDPWSVWALMPCRLATAVTGSRSDSRRIPTFGDRMAPKGSRDSDRRVEDVSSASFRKRAYGVMPEARQRKCGVGADQPASQRIQTTRLNRPALFA